MNATPEKSNEAQARVIVVDDHPLVRIGLQQLILNDKRLEYCGDAENAPDALHLIEQVKPDIAIVDITLKGSSGLDLSKSITDNYSAVKVLVYSMHDDMLYAPRALRAGALGYVNKQSESGVILEAIHKALQGEIVLDERVKSRMLGQMISGTAKPDEHPLDTLSNRELQVVHLLGKGLSVREISEQLHRSPKTIETYRARIKKKLALSTTQELSRFAYQMEREASEQLQQ